MNGLCETAVASDRRGTYYGKFRLEINMIGIKANALVSALRYAVNERVL